MQRVRMSSVVDQKALKMFLPLNGAIYIPYFREGYGEAKLDNSWATSDLLSYLS